MQDLKIKYSNNKLRESVNNYRKCDENMIR